MIRRLEFPVASHGACLPRPAWRRQELHNVHFQLMPSPRNLKGMPLRLLSIRWKRGFSTLELSIVLSIVLVLSALAFPYWEEILTSYRQSTATGIFVSDLRLARFEAIKDNASVRVRLLTPSSYVIERDTGGSWEALRPTIDFTERYWTRGVSLSSESDPAVFYSSGRAEGMVTFLLTSDGQEVRQVSVSLSGMVRQE